MSHALSDPRATEVPSVDGMILIPGGTFRMGSDQHYPEEAPAHRVTRRRLLDRPDAGHQPRVPQVRRRDRPRHLRRDPARPEGLSRRAAAHAQGRLARVHAARSIRSTCATGPVVDASRSAPTGASPTGRSSSIKRPRRSSGRARRLSRRRGLCATGPARTCRPKPSGSSPRAAGSTAPSSPGATSSRPTAATWPTPGRAHFPHENLHADGYERTSPVTALPAERLRPPRHDRQRLGMDHRLVSRRSTRPTPPKACCIPREPARRSRGRELRSAPAATSASRARCSRAARICARRTTAAATARRRAMPQPVDTSTSHVGFRCVVARE